VGWILLGSLQFREPGRMAELIEANCGALRLEATFPPRTYLFRLAASGDAPEAGAPACRAIAEYRAAHVGREVGADDDAPGDDEPPRDPEPAIRVPAPPSGGS
jgi:hypothetical protein